MLEPKREWRRVEEDEYNHYAEADKRSAEVFGETIHCVAVDAKPVRWWVKVTYFKPSGKYYTHGSYMTEQPTTLGIADELEVQRRMGKPAPGLAGSGKEFILVVLPEDAHPNGYPIMLRELEPWT